MLENVEKINSIDKYKRCHSHCHTSLCQTVITTNSALFSAPVQQQPSLWESVNHMINSTEALSTKQLAVPAEAGERVCDCSLNVESTAPSLGWWRIGSHTTRGVNWNTLINLKHQDCFVNLPKKCHNSQCRISRNYAFCMNFGDSPLNLSRFYLRGSLKTVVNLALHKQMTSVGLHDLLTQGTQSASCVHPVSQTFPLTFCFGLFQVTDLLSGFLGHISFSPASVSLSCPSRFPFLFLPLWCPDF